LASIWLASAPVEFSSLVLCFASCSRSLCLGSILRASDLFVSTAVGCWLFRLPPKVLPFCGRLFSGQHFCFASCLIPSEQRQGEGLALCTQAQERRLQLICRSLFLIPAQCRHQLGFTTRICSDMVSRSSFDFASTSSSPFVLFRAEFSCVHCGCRSMSSLFTCDFLPLQILALVSFLRFAGSGAPRLCCCRLSRVLRVFDFCFRFSASDCVWIVVGRS
jgi:hypothetical protein